MFIKGLRDHRKCAIGADRKVEPIGLAHLSNLPAPQSAWREHARLRFGGVGVFIVFDRGISHVDVDGLGGAGREACHGDGVERAGGAGRALDIRAYRLLIDEEGVDGFEGEFVGGGGCAAGSGKKPRSKNPWKAGSFGPHRDSEYISTLSQACGNGIIMPNGNAGRPRVIQNHKTGSSRSWNPRVALFAHPRSGAAPV